MKDKIKKWMEGNEGIVSSSGDSEWLFDIMTKCFNDLAPQWVSVDVVPMCDFEHTDWDDDCKNCLFDGMVSNTFLISDGDNIGFGHYQDNGVWRIYKGEHDFMNIEPGEITHYKQLLSPSEGE